MEKKFEKLDYDILNTGLDETIIPTVESIETPIKPTQPDKVEDAGDDEEEILEVNSITDLEDEEEEEITEEPVAPAKKTNTESEEESEAKGLAKYFSSKGFLEYEEDEFQDDEDWVETKLFETLSKKAESSLDPEIRRINELYKKGVSLETLIRARVEEEKLESIDDVTIQENETVAENVVRTYLTTVLEHEEEDVDETITSFKDAGILAKEALKAKPKIIKYNEKMVEAERKQAELDRQERVRQENERMTILKKIVDTTPEFIKGVPVAEVEKGKLYEGITKKDRAGLTEYQKKLMDPEMQMKVAQFVILMDGDLSKLSDKLKTKITTEMKKQTNSYKEKSKGDIKKDAASALDYLKKFSRK